MLITEENILSLAQPGKIVAKRKWLLIQNSEIEAFNVDAIIVTIGNVLCVHVIKKVVLDKDMYLLSESVENYWNTFYIDDVASIPIFIENSLPRVKDEYSQWWMNKKARVEILKKSLQNVANAFNELNKEEITEILFHETQVLNFFHEIARIVEDKDMKMAYSIARTAMKTGMVTAEYGNSIASIKIDSVSAFHQEEENGERVTKVTVADGKVYVVKQNEKPALFYALDLLLGPLTFQDYFWGKDIIK